MSKSLHDSLAGKKIRLKGSNLRTLALICLSAVATVLSLTIAEVSLRLLGLYDDLASAALMSSELTIWEPPHNAVQYQDHPDLFHKVRIEFDGSGVRNHSNVETSGKKSIVAVFGDSFTLNRRIVDRFSFTSVLDNFTTKEHSVANFGVSGYGLDQSYLRYKKYDGLRIDHVVYVLCSNDLRNLYENNIAILENGNVRFKKSTRNRFRQTVGQLRLTYLILSAYHQFKSFVRPAAGSVKYAQQKFWDRLAERELKREHHRRFHDVFADSMLRDFLSGNPNEQTVHYVRLFRAILASWRRDLETLGRRFTIIVLPTKEATDLAEKLRLDESFDTIFLKKFLPEYEALRFANNGHWSEVGNVKAAFVLAQHPTFSRYLKQHLDLSVAEQQLISDIRRMYALHPKRYVAGRSGVPTSPLSAAQTGHWTRPGGRSDHRPLGLLLLEASR